MTTKNQRKILIADDHQMIRMGLRFYFQRLEYLDIQEASRCSEIMNKLSQNSFTHCVLDLNLPDGTALEILPNIKRLYPDLKVSVYSMQPAETYRNALRRYGVAYYVSKSTFENETMELFRKFLNDEPSPFDDQEDSDSPFAKLTTREMEVLHYLLQGKSVVQVADILNLSRTTVATHKGNILEKTNTANFVELCELADLYNIE